MKKHLLLTGFCGSLISPTSTRFLSSIPSSSSSSSPFALKNVTKTNFESTLNDLRRHVKDANFVAIDLEMTGVTSAPWRESSEFDRFDVRYLKLKDSADKFAVVQFGVCPFRWDSNKRSFIAYPHNFFIFPRQEIAGITAPHEFLCQTTSVDFLAKHQFDFNTCIREGISYLSKSQEAEALQRLKSMYEDRLLSSSSVGGRVAGVQLTRVSDILFSERLKNKIGDWRDGLLGSIGVPDIDMNSSNSNYDIQTIFFKLRPALSLSGFSSHQLRLIQSVVKDHFEDLEYICARGEGETSNPQQLVVYTHSQNDRESLEKEVSACCLKEEELNINTGIGFRHVIDLLASEQKLIVGHNCFLDLAHVYSKFMGPLPSSADEFASSIRKHFPYIIDSKMVLTKNILLHHMMKKTSSTSLSKAFVSLCPHLTSGDEASTMPNNVYVNVEVEVDDTRSLNWNPGTKHEAGYDAFMTGCVFAQACGYIGIDFHDSSMLDLAHNEKLQKYINFIYLSWMHGDIIDLRTGICTVDANNPKSRHSKITFSNILLLWGFPDKLKASEIKECLSKAFGSESVTSIYRLDETAVFIQFSEVKLVTDFLELKETFEINNVSTSESHPLSTILEGGTCAADYEAYKEICSSSISKISFADQADEVGIKSGKGVVRNSENMNVDRYQADESSRGSSDTNDQFYGDSPAEEVESFPVKVQMSR